MGCSVKQVLLWLATLFLAYSLLLPILIVVLAINESIRLMLKLFLLCSRSDYELISDGIENIYPTNPNFRAGMMMGILVTADTNVNLEEEREHFQKAVLQKPDPHGSGGHRMYEKLEKILDVKWGYGCRKKGEFDIKHHVILWTETLPANGKFYTQHEFQADIIVLLSNHLNYSSKPGWEWVIIPKVQFEGDDTELKTIRVFRCHHSYMDGISAGLLVTECLMDFQNGSESPPFILDPKAKLPDKIESYNRFDNVKGIILLPYYIMKGILASPVAVQDPFAAGKSLGLKHYGVSKKIEFNLVRDMRLKLSAQKTGSRGTTNVICSILMSALEQVLDENGKLSEQSMLKLYAPTAIFPYKDSRPRNQVLLTRFYIPLSKRTEMKLVDITGPGDYSFPMLYFLLALGHFPQKVFQRVIPILISKLTTTSIFTSIPGTRTKGYLHCGGGLVSDVGGWVGVSNDIGITVVAISYGEHIRFWCAVDDSVMNRREFNRFLELLTLQNGP